jgi:uncharacterized protein
VRRFEWDPEKAQSNLRKHGLSFLDGARVWTDPERAYLEPTFVDGEWRDLVLGSIGGFVLAVVVHTERQLDGEEIVRIISVRKATRQERRLYEDGHNPRR